MPPGANWCGFVIAAALGAGVMTAIAAFILIT
jgi:hypothetical protein